MRRALPGEEFLVRRAGSPFWWARFTVAGERVRRSTETADRALAAACATKLHTDLYRRLVLREAEPARPVDMPWGEAAERFRLEVCQHTEHGRRHQTHVLTVLTAAIGADTALRELTDDRMAGVMEAMRAPREGREAPLSPASVNRYLALAHAVCDRATSVWGVLVGDWSPAAHRLKEPPGREVFLDFDQARRLMGEACGHLRPILLVELLTGLRMRNVVELQWESVSLDLGRAVLIAKGGRRLRVELPGTAVKLLEGIEPDPRARTGPVFRFANPAVACRCPRCVVRTQHQGEPIRDIRRAFGGAARRAGVLWDGQSRLRFHDLRHTFASWLLDATGNLGLVQEALGHAQIATTRRYAHLLPGKRGEAAQAVADRLERLEPGKRKLA